MLLIFESVASLLNSSERLVQSVQPVADFVWIWSVMAPVDVVQDAPTRSKVAVSRAGMDARTVWSPTDCVVVDCALTVAGAVIDAIVGVTAARLAATGA
jgi:hypothetical protein